MPPIQVLMSLIGIVIILIAAYYATYYIGKVASGRTNSRVGNSNRRINLLERFAISKDKSFCIVEIAGKIYFIGITNQSMTLLDTLDADEFAETTGEYGQSPAWNAGPAKPFGGKLVNRLAAFMSAKMEKTGNAKMGDSAKGRIFSDDMRSAREKSISGQPARKDAERTDRSEGEE